MDDITRISTLNRERQTPDWRRRLLTIGIVVVAALLILALGVVAFSAYATQRARQPFAVANAYCRDLRSHNYAAAYHLLSSSYQQTTTQAHFVADAALHDQVEGPITDCALTQNTPDSTLHLIDSTTVPLRIVRRAPASGTLALSAHGDAWRIDALSGAAQGRDLGAIDVSHTFCSALANKDYNAAYATLSTEARSGASQDAFTAAFSRDFGTSQQLLDCAPTLASYTVTPAGDKATLDVTFHIGIQGNQGTTPVAVPATMQFVRENATWKLSSIAINAH